MEGLPVTVRFLDPPLHEFVPHTKEQQLDLAKSIGITHAEFLKRADALKESNPMMGHRGVRLGVTYPEITAMQARAISEAASDINETVYQNAGTAVTVRTKARNMTVSFLFLLSI